MKLKCTRVQGGGRREGEEGTSDFLRVPGPTKTIFYFMNLALAMSRENKQFCRDCNNMLYPKEDKAEHTLYLACRNCEHFEECINHIIYTNTLKKEMIGSTLSSEAKDIANDPTLKRVKDRQCLKCKNNRHVVFQTRDRQEESILTLNYVCCNCLTVCGDV